MLLAPEDDAAAWTEDEFDAFRERLSASYYGDPEDDSPTPLETVVPWDPDGDDDRRRADRLHLLHLTQAEWDLIDDLTEWRVPLTGIGSRCVHTPHRIPDGLVGGVHVRPSPVIGGTFLIFPGN